MRTAQHVLPDRPGMEARLRQGRVLARPLVHMFGPAVAAIVALGAVIAGLSMRSSELPIRGIRFAAMILASGSAFIVDDVSADLSTSSPTGALPRALFRMVVGLAPVYAMWAAVLIVLSARYPAPIPMGALVLELTVMVFVALAAASFAARVGEGRGGLAGAPAVFASVVFSFLAPTKAFVFATEPVAAHRALVALAVAVIVVGMADRDPGRRSSVNRFRAHLRQGGRQVLDTGEEIWKEHR